MEFHLHKRKLGQLHECRDYCYSKKKEEHVFTCSASIRPPLKLGQACAPKSNAAALFLCCRKSSMRTSDNSNDTFSDMLASRTSNKTKVAYSSNHFKVSVKEQQCRRCRKRPGYCRYCEGKNTLNLKRWKVTISPAKLLHWFHSVEQFCWGNSEFSLNSVWIPVTFTVSDLERTTQERCPGTSLLSKATSWDISSKRADAGMSFSPKEISWDVVLLSIF